ncbi:MAG: DNA gyrase inhibitor YacG [Beijerinckiaceae bacterium]
MTSLAEGGREPRPAPPCPICGKPRDERFRPFCSKRCADIDLNRWLKGGYVIPASNDSDEDGDQPPIAPDLK